MPSTARAGRGWSRVSHLPVGTQQEAGLSRRVGTGAQVASQPPAGRPPRSWTHGEAVPGALASLGLRGPQSLQQLQHRAAPVHSSACPPQPPPARGLLRVVLTPPVSARRRWTGCSGTGPPPRCGRPGGGGHSGTEPAQRRRLSVQAFQTKEVSVTSTSHRNRPGPSARRLLPSPDRSHTWSEATHGHPGWTGRV